MWIELGPDFTLHWYQYYKIGLQLENGIYWVLQVFEKKIF